MTLALQAALSLTRARPAARASGIIRARIALTNSVRSISSSFAADPRSLPVSVIRASVCDLNEHRADGAQSVLPVLTFGFWLSGRKIWRTILAFADW
jgi:hypothetical protein